MEKGILPGLQKEDMFSASLLGLLLNSIAADAVKRWPENKNVREIRMSNFAIMHFCSEFRIIAASSQHALRLRDKSEQLRNNALLLRV